MITTRRSIKIPGRKSPKASGKKSGAHPSNAFFRSAGSGFFMAASESDSTFFQPKLTTGQPGDKFEREADSVADKVTTNQPSGSIVQQPAISAVQKADLKEEEKPVQKAEEKREEERPIQKAEEKKEEEKPVQKADEKKEEERPVQKAEKKEEDKPVQMVEEKEEREEEGVQKKEEAPARQDGNAWVGEQLSKQNGNGTPLSGQLKDHMESSFGTSFEKVRIHNNTEAANMSKAIGAKAFTHGNDIYFNTGYFAPYSQTGKHLLAHELTHVVQQSGGKQGNANPVQAGTSLHREVELDPVTRNPTGNYLFRIGPNLTPEFFRRFKQYVADGSLTDDELNRLRLYAIAHRGTLTQEEKLLMAAGLDAANHPAVGAHATGPLSLPMANITPANRDHVNNIGRATLSPAYEAMVLRAIMAMLNGNFEEAATEMANIQEGAIQEILAIGGRSWTNQAENLVAFLEINNIHPLPVLNAMYNAASDSTSGDQVMAGIVYATASHAGHSTTAQIGSGSIKVDALVPSALRALTGNRGGDAFYVPAGVNDRLKADTLYVPTSLDILNVVQRALVIHELTHAMDDAASVGVSVSPQINLEATAYRSQVRYIMDQLLATPADDLDMEVVRTRRMADSALFQWAYAVEARANQARYEAIAKRILLQSSTVSEADFTRVMGMPLADVDARLRNAILSLPQYSGNPNVVIDGLRGQSILDHVN